MSDRSTYDTVYHFNHWVIAVAIIAMLGFGFYLEYGGLARDADVFGWFSIPAHTEVTRLANLAGSAYGWVGIGLAMLSSTPRD